MTTRDLVEEYCRSQGVPGASVAVFDNHAILDTAAVGTASLERPDIPMTADTLFRIHSVTKLLTCTAVLILANRGELSLTDEARSFIAATHDAPDLGQITVRHLLTHTSGLGRGLHADDARHQWSPGLGQSVLDYVGRAGSLSGPGLVYDYSNAGIALLGYIIERVTGHAFPRAMRETLFDLAGMDASCYDPRRAMSYPLSQQHVRDGRGLHVRHHFDYSNSARPFTGAYCSVADLAHFGIWHLSQTSGGKHPVFDEVPVPHADLGLDIGLSYGLGCYVGPRYGDVAAYGQIGYATGAWAAITLLRRPPVGVAWCDNVGLDEVPIVPRQRVIEALIEAHGGGQRTWRRPEQPEQPGQTPDPVADETTLTGVYRRPGGLPVIVGARGGKLTVGDSLRTFGLRRLFGKTYVADAQAYAGTLPWRPHDHSSQCCISFVPLADPRPHHLLLNGTPYLRAGDVAE